MVYGSLYGHTASAAQEFAAKLQAKTGRGVSLYDASETDVSYLISEVWRCSRVVLFCPTYNMGIYPPVNDLDDTLTIRSALHACDEAALDAFVDAVANA